MDVSDKKLAELISRELLESVSANLAIINRNYNVISANRNFEDYFGDRRGKHCYEVHKGRDKPCTRCQSSLVFEDIQTSVSDETGVNRYGRISH